MPRPKKAVKPVNSLLTALQFISCAQRPNGAIEQTHCRLFNKLASASNSIISAAHKIVEEIQICPQTASLITALENSDGVINLTVIDTSTLSVKSGNFTATINCIEQDKLPPIYPDQWLVQINDGFKAALNVVNPLINESGEKIINAAFELRSGTVLATNGIIILQAWHGFTFPAIGETGPNQAPARLLVPKAFITAINKQSKSLYLLGAGETSITAGYQDESWIKSQIYPANYLEQWPDLESILNTVPMVPETDVPKNLFAVAKKLQPFSEDGLLYFMNDCVRVINKTTMTSASDVVAGVPITGFGISIKALLQIEPYCKKVAWLNDKMLFYSNEVRGAVGFESQQD